MHAQSRLVARIGQFYAEVTGPEPQELVSRSSSDRAFHRVPPSSVSPSSSHINHIYGERHLPRDSLTTPRPQLNRQPYNNQGYMPNGAPAGPGPVPGATPLLPNQGRILQQGPIRVLCIADVRGRTSTTPGSCAYLARLTISTCR